MAWLAVQERIWPLWRFHATVGQYGGWCWWGNGQLGGSGPLHGQIGGSKPQLAILAGQYHHNNALFLPLFSFSVLQLMHSYNLVNFTSLQRQHVKKIISMLSSSHICTGVLPKLKETKKQFKKSQKK
jgi:hypothetical protein